MEIQTERLRALVGEQRELIIKLLHENRRLKTLTRSMGNRIQDLEQKDIVIDRAIAEIPVDLDLVPKDCLNNY